MTLYVDAVRGMRARQIAWRLRRAVPPSLLAVGTCVARPPAPRLLAAGLGCSPAPQAGLGEAPHEHGRFEAYGASRPCALPDFWNDPSDGVLFLFHLHGFVSLAEYAAGRRCPQGDDFWARVVADWLARCGKPHAPAWNPYPTSLRIIAWSAALSAIDSWAPALRTKVAEAILQQARYLGRAVEHDIGGNHVIKNATALAFAGALFPSTSLLWSALRLLQGETALQVLADGGHEERSTSYHREVLKDLADVRELLKRSEREVPRWLDECYARMERWLRALAGPDDRLPLLNDAWEGPPVARRGASPVTVLADTGYVVLRHESDQLIFDTGALCPTHLPPHAHADALSVVLWLNGKPVIVDPGTYAYTGRERDRFRSTRAHATVAVDGEDQCVFWGDFRAAGLPHVRRIGPREDGPLIVVSGWHDGYRRLDDPVVHERTVAWWPGQGVVVLDRLRCRRSHSIRSTLPCAPGISVGSEFRLGPAKVAPIGDGAVEIVATDYSPRLGSKLQAAAIVDARLSVAPGEVFGWAIFREHGRLVSASGDKVVLTVAGRRHAFRAFQR